MSGQWKSSDVQFTSLDKLCPAVQDWDCTSKSTKAQLLMRVVRAMASTNFTYKNHSLDFDPSAAVHRQARFTEKMSQFGWLQSPTIGSTLHHAIDRYSKFFTLIAKFSGMMVPALDVDLVWHTHQLSPARYITFCRAMADGRFIDHNDTAEKGEVRDGFQQMQELYRKQFAEEYIFFRSWNCEPSRVSPDVDLSDNDYGLLELLIRRERKRKKALDLPVIVEFADCLCLCWKAGNEGDNNKCSQTVIHR